MFARFEIDLLVQTLLAATETSISNFASGSRVTRKQGGLCSVPCENGKRGIVDALHWNCSRFMQEHLARVRCQDYGEGICNGAYCSL